MRLPVITVPGRVEQRIFAAARYRLADHSEHTGNGWLIGYERRR
jgi:hypothetical protein